MTAGLDSLHVSVLSPLVQRKLFRAYTQPKTGHLFFLDAGGHEVHRHTL